MKLLRRLVVAAVVMGAFGFTLIVGAIAAVQLNFFSTGDILVGAADQVFKPSAAFDDSAKPASPDYADARAWAAYPGRSDGADARLWDDGDTNEAAAPADAFFLHPTTFLSPLDWNGPAHDKSMVMREVDDAVMENMASAFNACCRVFAPRYRQATFGAMFNNSANGHKAIELAFDDVRRAFRYYIEHENNGRPFILAGHSQGSWHVQRLIAEEIQGTPLERQLVVAYTPGYLTPRDVFERRLTRVPVCTSATSTGCVAVWNTFGQDGSARFHRARVEHFYGTSYEAVGEKPTVCVNPITWTTQAGESPRDAYLGAAAFGPMTGLGASFMSGALTARCDNGILRIERYGLAHLVSALTLPEDDNHPYDFSLFYLNIRANAVARTGAWIAKPKT
ncbi:MAG: DUF3089 domain-containing protein [Alphaproteobacteria bacterium]|nr:DUF3089 domain-containing protein [Alphaproteobacteria bacterium]